MSWTYKLLIDPLTRGLREQVKKEIEPGSTALDIACGPGTLLVELSSEIKYGTGIDLDSDKINFARRYSVTNKIPNLKYVEADASKIADFFEDKFDYVVLSLAIHQFPENLRERIIEQAIKVGRNLIFADYTVPVPGNISGLLSKTIERIAGKEHYSAYKSFVKNDGLNGIVKQFDLNCISLSTTGSGVFTIMKLKIGED